MSQYLSSPYKIPNYQREYAWEEYELNDFWNDLINLYDSEDQNSIHFFGQIVIHNDANKHEKFIIENAEERGYLPWAVVASGCFPRNHHLRKIYNEFTLLDDEVKAEVLRQADLNVPLIKGFDWVDEKIGALEESSRKLGLGDAFSYA